MTDEIRVTIAAPGMPPPARHRETDFFKQARDDPRLSRRPTSPRGSRSTSAAGIFLEGEQARLGEASAPRRRGRPLLGRCAASGAFDPKDGHNVVLHEFAHQLDQEDGAADGAPILANRSRYAPWARVLGSEFEQLKEADRAGRKTVLDGYGATNPAEFFAVATECFFEKPVRLKKKHPELYAELMRYYHVDPEAAFAV